MITEKKYFEKWKCPAPSQSAKELEKNTKWINILPKTCLISLRFLIFKSELNELVLLSYNLQRESLWL